eukprot:1315052-Amorphochlora_amoeboformis.AAC.3
MGAGPGGAKGGRGDLGEASDLDGFFTFDEDSEGSVSKFCSKADMMQVWMRGRVRDRERARERKRRSRER